MKQPVCRLIIRVFLVDTDESLFVQVFDHIDGNLNTIVENLDKKIIKKKEKFFDE